MAQGERGGPRHGVEGTTGERNEPLGQKEESPHRVQYLLSELPLKL